MKPGSRHDYEGSSTSVARIPPEFHASPSSPLSLGLDLRGHVLLSSIRWLGEGTKGTVRVMPSDLTGEVERSRSLVRTISKLFCPSPLFLSFSANPFRSGTFFLSFLFFFLFKGEGFLFFFLYFYFIFVSLWNPWEKLEILCKGNDLSIFINFINSIVAS